QKLLTRLGVFSERAAQRAGDRLRVLLLDPAHHHAQVDGFDHDADAGGSEHLLDRRGDFFGEPLLNLQPPREDLDQTGELGEAYDTTIRDVRDVCLPKEWE